MAFVEERTPLEDLNQLGPEDLLSWAGEAHGARAAIITSFQNTGCVMIDMAHRAGLSLRLVTVDTLRLHRETYDLMRRIEERYGIGVERFSPDPARLRKMVADHGEYLFFDTHGKQQYCCQIRKVGPNRRALATVDAWITGLRRDQSNERAAVNKAEVVHRDGRELLRLCPLANWSEQDVSDYIEEYKVPTNALYAEGYTSIGCEICSTPTLPNEDRRAGRWRWFNQMDSEVSKECGIHTDGSGI